MPRDFCEFGMLPPSQCEHCRRHAPLVSPYTWPPGAIPTQRQIDRRYLIDAEYHAHVYLWRQLLREAFGPEHDWTGLMELAETTLGLGPWTLAQWSGRCKGCGERYEDGDTVRYSEDEGGMVCLGCGAVE